MSLVPSGSGGGGGGGAPGGDAPGGDGDKHLVKGCKNDDLLGPDATTADPSIHDTRLHKLLSEARAEAAHLASGARERANAADGRHKPGETYNALMVAFLMLERQIFGILDQIETSLAPAVLDVLAPRVSQFRDPPTTPASDSIGRQSTHDLYSAFSSSARSTGQPATGSAGRGYSGSRRSTGQPASASHSPRADGRGGVTPKLLDWTEGAEDDNADDNAKDNADDNAEDNADGKAEDNAEDNSTTN